MSWQVLHTQMKLHVSLPQLIVECYIPRWYFIFPSLSVIFWILHTQVIFHIPCFSELLSVTYPDDISCLPPSMNCWVLHTQMPFHVSLPQWVVEYWLPRCHFMPPSLNELLSVAYPDDISCLSPIVDCYIPRRYFMSPFLNELLSITHPDDISHLPPSMSCWVLHMKMTFHVPLPQWVVECYIRVATFESIQNSLTFPWQNNIFPWQFLLFFNLWKNNFNCY